MDHCGPRRNPVHHDQVEVPQESSRVANWMRIDGIRRSSSCLGETIHLVIWAPRDFDNGVVSRAEAVQVAAPAARARSIVRHRSRCPKESGDDAIVNLSIDPAQRALVTFGVSLPWEVIKVTQEYGESLLILSE